MPTSVVFSGVSALSFAIGMVSHLFEMIAVLDVGCELQWAKRSNAMMQVEVAR